VDWLRIAPADEVVERVNLLHGDFLPAHQSRDLRPLKVAAALALAAAVLMYGSLLLESRELKARDMALNQQMKTLFQQQFPGEPWLGRPQYQVQTLLDARDGGTDAFGFQFLLEVITGMTRQHGAQIEELNFRDDEMIVLCNVRSLSVLDDIRQGLQGLPGLTAELLSSGARDNQISGRFRVSRG
jgi:type II secretory pathway component PulL